MRASRRSHRRHSIIRRSRRSLAIHNRSNSGLKPGCLPSVLARPESCIMNLANSPSVLEPDDFDEKRMLPEELTGNGVLRLAKNLSTNREIRETVDFLDF